MENKQEEGYPERWQDWFYFPNLDAWAIKWTVWFVFLYVLPFIPYPLNPWGYVEHIYVRGWFGIPGFMCEAVSLWLIVIVSIGVFYNGARRRGLFDEQPVPPTSTHPEN